MRNVFKKDSERSGYIITETTKGWKVEIWSAYEDELNKTYYIKHKRDTEDFPPGFNRWEESINEYGTTYADLFIKSVLEGGIMPYRVIKTQ